jgi:hypothetical protein
MPTIIQRIKIELFKLKEWVLGRTKKQPINAYATEIPGRRPDMSALPPLPGQAGHSLPNQYSTELAGRRSVPIDLLKDPRFKQQAPIPPYMQPGVPAQESQPVKERPPHWIWNVPGVIGGHLDWIYSQLPATKKKRQQKRDNEQRYEQFVELANGRR